MHRFLLVLLACAVLTTSTARAQAAAKKAENARTLDPKLTFGGRAATSKALDKHGKLKITGGIFLFQYLPEFGNSLFEIYTANFFLDWASADGLWSFHQQIRGRTTPLRPFYKDKIWPWETYVSRKVGSGAIHVGQFHRRVGIFWDDSFFGNVQYFNGLKLNPDIGVEYVGHTQKSDQRWSDYSVQYFTVNDKYDGSLNGRDVESDPNARAHNAVTARYAPGYKLNDTWSLTPGVSFYTARIDRNFASDFQLTHAASELTLQSKRLTAYGELSHVSGERFDAAHPRSRPGYDDGTYHLLGARYQLSKGINARCNVSWVNYVGQAATEYQCVPGLYCQLNPTLSAWLEYDTWSLRPDNGPKSFIDRSVSLVFYQTW